MRFAVHLGLAGLLLLSAPGLSGCQSNAESRMKKTQHLQDEYNKLYPAYEKDCLNDQEGEAAVGRILENQNTLTAEQEAAIETKEKAKQARCKPTADRLDKIQREIVALTNAQ
ncbi:MAG: hypothetical protein ABI383_04950 [Acidobacteriaceae bacterium]